MAPNPRFFKACVMSLALLFACGASAQTPTANEEAPVASPARQDPAPREAPAAEPRERPQPPAAAETPSRSEPRVETPVRIEPRAETPVREPVRPAPETSVERAAAAELPAQLPEKTRAAAPKKTVPKPQITAAADPPVVAPAVAPAIAPVPATAAIPPGAVSNPSASLARAAGPITSPAQSPVRTVKALPSDNDATVTTDLTSFRYIWVSVLLLLAAGLAYFGWKVFKYSAWHFPPGY